MADAERHFVVITTCPDADTARRMAERLVDAGLAACVQLIPEIHSVFRWQGRRDQASETLLLMKTRAGVYRELESEIISLHPYTVPEIIALPVAMGLEAYLSWIDNNTGFQYDQTP